MSAEYDGTFGSCFADCREVGARGIYGGRGLAVSKSTLWIEHTVRVITIIHPFSGKSWPEGPEPQGRSDLPRPFYFDGSEQDLSFPIFSVKLLMKL